MAFTSQGSSLCLVAFVFCLLWTSLITIEVLPLICLPCSSGAQLLTECFFLVTPAFRTLTHSLFPLPLMKVLKLTLLSGKLPWLNSTVVRIVWDTHFGHFGLKLSLIHYFAGFLNSICNSHGLIWSVLVYDLTEWTRYVKFTLGLPSVCYKNLLFKNPTNIYW